MTGNRIKLLYIVGPTRSGSTILSNILGEIDGFFNVGELVDIWDRGLSLNGVCSCGTHLGDCDVWNDILSEAYGKCERSFIQKMITFRDYALHSRNVIYPSLLPSKESKIKDKLGEYAANLDQLYRAASSVTNSTVIIDASKYAGYLYTLSLIPILDLNVVHLVRDPRGVAFSWMRKKEGLQNIGPIDSSIHWNLRNFATEIVLKKWKLKNLRLYYEDFIRTPQKNVKGILRFLKEESAHLPFLSDKTVLLGTNHGVYGNPDRFKTGAVDLILDKKWATMTEKHKFLITSITWPLLIRYRYPLLP